MVTKEKDNLHKLLRLSNKTAKTSNMVWYDETKCVAITRGRRIKKMTLAKMYAVARCEIDKKVRKPKDYWKPLTKVLRKRTILWGNEGNIRRR